MQRCSARQRRSTLRAPCTGINDAIRGHWGDDWRDRPEHCASVEKRLVDVKFPLAICCCWRTHHAEAAATIGRGFWLMPMPQSALPGILMSGLDLTASCGSTAAQSSRSLTASDYQRLPGGEWGGGNRHADMMIAASITTTQRGDTGYAPDLPGVTNGDTHDHSIGDGARLITPRSLIADAHCCRPRTLQITRSLQKGVRTAIRA